MAQALIAVGYAKQEDKRGKFKAGWSTKLSFRTYNKLKAEGIVS
ncbi:hypothetical protein [Burkholderia territorii]|nr:hypothetical protein [Burkholderia territorii]